MGSAAVVFFKKVNKNIFDAMLSLSAGIMLSASFWSLLAPSVTIAKSIDQKVWLIPTLGVLIGALMIYLADYLYRYFKRDKKDCEHNLDYVHNPDCVHNQDYNHRQSWLLATSMTIHNIPEGIVVGVAFGAIIYNIEGASLTSAIMLALGIGLQNLPEGLAVSMALRRNNLSRFKAFMIGQLTGIVEPIFGIIGALLVLKVQVALPFLLAFAAGSMIYVVILELIPESQTNKHKEIMTIVTIVGFVIMMILDLAFG